VDGGFQAMSALLALPHADGPTAVIAYNDLMALGVLHAVRAHHLRVPEDISVIGFDNIPQSAMVYPSLTTVQQPLEKMGRAATQILLDILKNPEKDVGRIELPTELIVRNSTSAQKDRTG
jgi:LacI family transcriptional regulator